jgi:lysophospholipase L1-like esterase
MPFGASIVSVSPLLTTILTLYFTNLPAQRCWRANLQAKLRNAGVKNFQFVGTQGGTCGGANVQQAHEGHPGYLATEMAQNNNLPGWLNTNPPDVILMLAGTNDILKKKSANDIIASYDILIRQMRAKNPNVQIIFSNLLPLDPARFPAQAVQGVKTLNQMTAAWAPGKSTLKSPVYYIDNFAGFDPVKDTDDGEHPLKGSGTEKMAVKFFESTKTAIGAVARSRGIKAKRVERVKRS